MLDIQEVVRIQAGQKARFKGGGGADRPLGPGRTRLGKQLEGEHSQKISDILAGKRANLPSAMTSLMDLTLQKGITTAGTSSREALKTSLTRLSGTPDTREGQYLLSQHDRAVQRRSAGVEEARRFQKDADREGAVEMGLDAVSLGRGTGTAIQGAQAEGVAGVQNVLAQRGDLVSNIGGGVGGYLGDLVTAQKYSKEFSPQQA